MIDFLFERFRKEYPERKAASLIYAIVCCQLMFFVNLKFNFWYGIIYIFIYLYCIGCYRLVCDEYIKIDFKNMDLKKDIAITIASTYILFQVLNAISVIFLFQRNLIVMNGVFMINNIFIMIYTTLFYMFRENKEIKIKGKKK